MQLIVLGMHRSGTSVLSRLLNMMGVYFAPEGVGTGANPQNPKGFWERRDVRNLNDSLLYSEDCDWNRLAKFDVDAVPEDALVPFGKAVRHLMLELDAHRPWMLKEPRLCVLLKQWRPFFELPICLFVHRSPVEIAHSLQTRNNVPLDAGVALWERYMRDALAQSEGLPRFGIAHADLMAAPVETTRRLHKALVAAGVRGLELPTDREILAFIDPKLHREHEDPAEYKKLLTAEQRKFHESLANGKAFAKAPPWRNEAQGKAILDTYEATLPPLVKKEPMTTGTPVALPTPAAPPGLSPKELELKKQLNDKAAEAVKLRDANAALKAQLEAKDSEYTTVVATTKSSFAAILDAKEREYAAVVAAKDQAFAAVVAAKDAEYAAVVGTTEREYATVVAGLEREFAALTANKEMETHVTLLEAEKGIAEQRAELEQQRAAVEQQLAAMEQQLQAASSYQPLADELQERLTAAYAELVSAGSSIQELQRSNAAFEQHVADLEAHVAQLTQQAQELADALAERTAENQASQRQLAASEARLAITSQRLTDVDAALEQRQREIAQLSGRLATTVAESERHAARASAHSEAQTRAAQEAARLTAALAKEKQTSDERVADVVKLTRLLLETQGERDDAYADLAAWRDAGMEWDAERQQRDALLEQLQQRLQAQESSLSWRITRPLRSTRRWLRPLPAHAAPVEAETIDEDAELLRQSALFDRDWYLQNYPDVAADGCDPVTHYLQFGAGEGRQPGPEFDGDRYLERYPDVAAAGANPLLHFLRFGLAEGRTP